jgi:hypothetical protein
VNILLGIYVLPLEIIQFHRLKQMAQELAPLGVGLVHSSCLVEVLPVDLATARVDIDIGKLVPALTFPQPANNVEDNDNEDGKVRSEESLGVHWSDGHVELSLLALLL